MFEGILALLSMRIIIVLLNLFGPATKRRFKAFGKGRRLSVPRRSDTSRVVRAEEERRESGEKRRISTNFPRLLPSRHFPVVNHTSEYLLGGGEFTEKSKVSRRFPTCTLYHVPMYVRDLWLRARPSAYEPTRPKFNDPVRVWSVAARACTIYLPIIFHEDRAHGATTAIDCDE